MENFIKTIGFWRERPNVPFDLFHLFWLIFTFVGIILVVTFYDKKSLRILYTVSAILMLIGEIYKQFVYSFSTGTFDYQWYYFPMQFCSTPLYAFTLASILKKGKLYDYISAYSGTYCIFAGMTVLLIPQTVFSPYLGVSVQSMLHHSLMVIVGAAALREYAKTFSLKLFMGGFYIFIFFFIIAEVLNFVIPLTTGEQVNMYFISKYMDLDVPFLSHVKKAFPYWFFVFLYALVYSEISIGVAYASHKLANRKKRY